MGVRGLKTFIDNNRDLTKGHELHHINLVIDGSALLYTLYGISSTNKLDFRYGGDFVGFAKEIKLFFKHLKECKISPVVVLDGGVDPSDAKLRTLLERLQSRLKTIKVIAYKDVHHEVLLPIMGKEVFRDVLVDLEIPFVASLFEADSDVALLANHLTCPVISNDSDFFVFDLVGGYIPLSTFNYKNVKTGTNPVNGFEYRYIQCLKYDIADLMAKFPQLDANLLPLFSTIMGNDYVDTAVFDNIFCSLPGSDLVKKSSKKSRPSSTAAVKIYSTNKRQNKMVQVLDWLKGKNIDEATQFLLQFLKNENRSKATNMLNHTIESYGQDSSCSRTTCLVAHLYGHPCNIDHSFKGHEEYPVLNWFASSFVEHALHPKLMDVLTSRRVFLRPQVEDFTLESSYVTSRRLQAYIFALLRTRDNPCKEVMVYDRKLGEIYRYTIEPLIELEDGTILPSLDELSSLSDSSKRTLLLKVINANEADIDTIVDEMGQFPISQFVATQLAMFILIINYTYRQETAFVCKEYFLALITCLIRYLLITKKCHGKQKFNENQTLAARSSLNKFTSLVKHNNASPFQPRIVHMFAQLQAVLYHYVQIDGLLGYVCPKVRIHKALDGLFLYNLAHDLISRKDPVLYVSELLGRQSKFNSVYLNLLKYVELFTNCPRFRENNSKKVAQLPRKTKRERKVGNKDIKELRKVANNKFNILKEDCN